MALIEDFEESQADGPPRSRTRVTCGYRTVEIDGIRAVQLSTYGSSERKIPGKTSQTIEIDRAHAAELIDILKSAFPGMS
ncbi:hypothetical protein [Janibacter sp. GS2]|uniref:hypothetical protein n=1 Tax=Janibacter sp. GS2 TaxID=3442646 RepID=UPI003EBC5089